MQCRGMLIFWQARLLLEEMIKEGVQRDTITYHTAIACTRRAGSRPAARLALSLIRDMMDDGLTPSVIAFTGAMAACNTAHVWAGALAIYGRMERARVIPDVVAVHEAMVAANGLADWQTALRLIEALSVQVLAQGGLRGGGAAGAARRGRGGAIGAVRGRRAGKRGSRGPGTAAGERHRQRSSQLRDDSRRMASLSRRSYELAARTCRVAGNEVEARRLETVAEELYDNVASQRESANMRKQARRDSLVGQTRPREQGRARRRGLYPRQ